MSIDPALLEERDFLLGSLDDLEAEYAAGDLDDADYESLKADYTTRAARVLRAIEAGSTRTDRGTDSEANRLMWLAGITVVATLAGILVAQFSGSRTLNDTITGEIRVTTRELCSRRSNCSGRVISTPQSTCTTTSSSCRPPTRRPLRTRRGSCVSKGTSTTPGPSLRTRRDRPRLRRRSSVRHGHRPRCR